MTPSLLRLAVVAVMALGLAGCGESFRYKLTLVVNTPDGPRRGASVVESAFWNFWFPERGIGHELRGEALYLDLGPGRRPLIALLTCKLHPKFGKALSWTQEAGPATTLMSRLYNEAPSQDYMDAIPRIAGRRGPRSISPDDLPDLVTFADPNDPKTVIEVDPNNLQATLGPDISWNEITIESTDEPVTKGIELRLPWIAAYYNKMLDGSRYHDKNTLANKLSTASFHQPSASGAQ